MKAAYHTLGCKVNQYETEIIRESFEREGFESVDESSFADVYVINTCTVTHLADRKSRQYIRRMKRVNKDAIIVVTGCYSQVSPEEVLNIEDVDIITGTSDKHKIVDLVKHFIISKERIFEVPEYKELKTYCETGILSSMEDRTRAYIKVQEGCNRFCSYCIIPYARGVVRSRSTSMILKEARYLIDRGYKEIVLTGINTALYGTEPGFTADVDDEGANALYGIESLIYLLDKMDGDFRIRLSSLEPTVVNRDYVSGLLKYEKLCHHLHLSIQSGSNSVIERMNRKYTRWDYLEIVKALRDEDPYFGITTDIIAGFPGESDDEFGDSIDVVKEASFLKVHVFQYSKRKGTKAFDMEEQIPAYIKKERSARLIKESEIVSRDFISSCIGIKRKVLFEEIDEQNDMVMGYTDNYIRVCVKRDDSLLGNFADVIPLKLFGDGLFAEIT